ncbi:MAG: hypothetical protein ABIS21_00685 [Acidimicrobiales bacterium]
MSAPSLPSAPVEPAEHGRWFWAGAVAGWGVMAAGVVGLMSESAKTRPANAARWVLGAAIAHDVLVAPAVILLGVLVGRVVPAAFKGIVQSALVMSAMVALFSYPFVRGFGRQAANPSILPRNYATGVAIVLGSIWVVAAVAIAVRVRTAPARRTHAGRD